MKKPLLFRRRIEMPKRRSSSRPGFRFCEMLLPIPTSVCRIHSAVFSGRSRQSAITSIYIGNHFSGCDLSEKNPLDSVWFLRSFLHILSPFFPDTVETIPGHSGCFLMTEYAAIPVHYADSEKNLRRLFPPCPASSIILYAIANSSLHYFYRLFIIYAASLITREYQNPAVHSSGYVP